MNKIWTNPIVITATIMLSLIVLGASIAYLFVFVANADHAPQSVSIGVAAGIITAAALCALVWRGIIRFHLSLIDSLIQRNDTETPGPSRDTGDDNENVKP